MAITDLTGYTWVAGNEELDIKSTNFNYYINFTSNSENYSQFRSEWAGGDQELHYGNKKVYDRDGGGWVYGSNYKTIQITGGTDVTNTELIAWLEANGTLTRPVTIHIYLNNTLTEVTYTGENKWVNASISGKTLTFPTSDTTYIDGRELFSTSGGTQRSVSGQDGIVENGYYVYDDSTWLDLTTLGLAAGTHTITAKATAVDFGDSNFSNEVSYTVEPLGETWILNDSQDRLLTDSENLYLEVSAVPEIITQEQNTLTIEAAEATQQGNEVILNG